MALTVASIFSGIGGIERGMELAGHDVVFQCEVLETAQRVLKCRFPAVGFAADLTQLRALPDVDVITAGFPCQDLSQAGQTRGIRGKNSSLVNQLFDLIEAKKAKPSWILLENVPFMLQLQKGRGMRHLVKRLEELGMRWAYRTVDARAFGIPQRRRRVIVLASKTNDPRSVLFADESKFQIDFDVPAEAYGFYWTEGNTGLGWTVDGVPTIKGGSGIGIPCPPAIWLSKTNQIVTPDIRDAERLQGFPADWTKPVEAVSKRLGHRWKLVGNAVSVPMAKWIGRSLAKPGHYDSKNDIQLGKHAKWPAAAWGDSGRVFAADLSEWPKCFSYKSLDEFLKFPPKPLSLRATSGFYGRLRKSNLRRPADFDLALAEHIVQMNPNGKASIC